MARPRIVRTKEEAEAVPLDQPIQIALTDESEIETKQEPEDRDAQARQEAEKKPVVAAVDRDDDEQKPDISALQKQIADLQKAEKLAQDRYEAERKRAEEAERRRNEVQTENTRFQEETSQAQYDAIVNALEASKAEAEAAERALERAEFDADAKAKSDAYRRLARAEANITRLEDGKAAYEARIAEAKARPKQEPDGPKLDAFEQAISNMPPLVKDWMRQHPDYMTDRRKNAKIQALHYDVEEEGHAFGTQPYVEAMEVKLGMREAPKKAEEQEEEQQQRITVVTQAPPTRDIPSSSTGKPASSTKVTLTAEEREIARLNGITEIEYAKQKLKLQELKRNGHYIEGAR